MKNIKKKEISKLLKEDKGWISIKDKTPEPGVTVIIRIFNPHYIYHEDKNSVYHAEDIKLATCLKDYEDPDNVDKFKWSIIHPYPLFDYSPLSKMDHLEEGSIVTHWAVPTKDDIKGWNSRFDISDGYLSLYVGTDDDHRQLLYRALMYGASMIGNAYMREKTDELLAFHIILQDMLNSMDKRICILDGKEVPLWDKEPDIEELRKGTDNSMIDNQVSAELKEIINSTKHMLDDEPEIPQYKFLEAIESFYCNLLKKSKDPHQYCIVDSIKYELRSLLTKLSIEPDKIEIILKEEN